MHCLPIPPDPPIAPIGPIPFEHNEIFLDPKEDLRVVENIALVNGLLKITYKEVSVFNLRESKITTLTTCATCDNSSPTLLGEITGENLTNTQPNLPPYFNTISVVVDVFLDQMNLRVMKSTIDVPAVIEPINVENEITAIIAGCDEIQPQNTQQADLLAVSQHDVSYYDNLPQYNIEPIDIITDLYIENNNIKYRKSKVKVLKVHKTINKDIISTASCDENVIDPPNPQPDPELPNDILFDKTSWDYLPPSIWKTALNSAADRWGAYIKLHPDTVFNMRKFIRGWNGIRASNIRFINQPIAGICAGCSITKLYSFPNQNNKINTLAFEITINVAIANGPGCGEIVDLFTHELGHALGIGFWSNINTGNSTLDGNIYINSLDAFNELAYNNSEDPNTIIPLENQGVSTSKNKHFENNNRIINDQNYPGLINEIMTSRPMENRVLSKLSIKNVVDIGYIEINPGVYEQGIILDT